MEYGDPTGVDKILVERHGYEWVNGKAWPAGTSPEPEIPAVDITPSPKHETAPILETILKNGT